MSEQKRDKDQLAFLKWFRRPNVDPNPRPDEVWHAAFAHVRKEEVEPLKARVRVLEVVIRRGIKKVESQSGGAK